MLKKILFEDISQEENEEEIFGKWFSPEIRLLPVEEPDTEEEEEIIDALYQYLGNDAPERLNEPNNKQIIIDLMAKHKYEQVFDPGEITVYRGIYLSEDYKEKLEKTVSGPAKTAIEIFLENDTTHFYKKLNVFGKLKPLEETNVFQSWSSAKEVAFDFAKKDEHYQPTTVKLVFYAKTANNMFFGKPFELAQSVGGLSNENETISYGPVKFYAVEVKKTKLIPSF